MTFGLRFLKLLGGTSGLARDSWSELFQPPFYFRLMMDQVYQIGIRSMPLILIVVGMVGMVMALQFGIGLEKFGGKLYVPKIVSVSIIRELGPAFASLMLAARVGAGITSEIGSMVVTEQVDAIRALGTSPLKIIVIPRILACLISLPLLTVLANLTGVAGGILVGTMDLGLDANFYIEKVISSLKVSDYLSGFFKTFFFALFIAIAACYYGLQARGGTRGVGLATTKSVVTSCILIVVSDYFLTKLFMIFHSWI